MKTAENVRYARRIQYDYSILFKLQLVEEIKQGLPAKPQAKAKYCINGDLIVTKGLRKYGNFDRSHRPNCAMAKSPGQKILGLEVRVRLLEIQKARAEYLAGRADNKAIIFDMLVDMAEKAYDVQIRKNYNPVYRTLNGKTQRNVSLNL